MSNEVTTMGNNLPAHLQGQGGSGFIEDDSALLSTPRVKLIQKTSKEYDDGMAKNGQFLLTSSGDALNELIFTPIKGHLEYITFTDDGQVDFQSQSESEAKATLGEDYWKARQMNILMLPYAKEVPAVYSFRGTAYKEGTKLYQMCKVSNAGCMFSRAYKLISTEKSGPGGKYHSPAISLARDIEGYSDENAWLTEEAFNLAKSIAEAV